MKLFEQWVGNYYGSLKSSKWNEMVSNIASLVNKWFVSIHLKFQCQWLAGEGVIPCNGDQCWVGICELTFHWWNSVWQFTVLGQMGGELWEIWNVHHCNLVAMWWWAVEHTGVNSFVVWWRELEKVQWSYTEKIWVYLRMACVADGHCEGVNLSSHWALAGVEAAVVGEDTRLALSRNCTSDR